ncbi:MAG TPA: hypothetical protein DDX39_04450 [Bacteroidales bacterium]|nr:MAG: hypothetical protein A2W98_10550 [Bacteroidetes bacterium GWF2_33_38]OFY73227.1 MAG: hypothetical protein A2265_02110 [Bacteroidetes bacterium RIFOXYA12_FULL_33_9]OFY86664.1 MAG: hypothetical protein A2236_13210 [Bacteroidetes bacterium RIFOXYA2_FULL_33_7]HBF87874.1 hypothetical protein [Bacteroidales bacterium]
MNVHCLVSQTFLYAYKKPRRFSKTEEVSVRKGSTIILAVSVTRTRMSEFFYKHAIQLIVGKDSNNGGEIKSY